MQLNFSLFLRVSLIFLFLFIQSTERCMQIDNVNYYFRKNQMQFLQIYQFNNFPFKVDNLLKVYSTIAHYCNAVTLVTIILDIICYYQYYNSNYIFFPINSSILVIYQFCKINITLVFGFTVNIAYNNFTTITLWN